MLAPGRLHLPSGLTLALPPLNAQGEATEGIRPEHLTGSAQGWPLTVRIVGTLGNEPHVSGDIGGVEASITIKTRDFPQLGSVVRVTPEPGRIQLLPERPTHRNQLTTGGSVPV